MIRTSSHQSPGEQTLWLSCDFIVEVHVLCDVSVSAPGGILLKIFPGPPWIRIPGGRTVESAFYQVADSFGSWASLLCIFITTEGLQTERAKFRSFFFFSNLGIYRKCSECSLGVGDRPGCASVLLLRPWGHGRKLPTLSTLESDRILPRHLPESSREVPPLDIPVEYNNTQEMYVCVLSPVQLFETL